MEKKRTNQKTKSVGNGEGSLYKSETLGCYVFQYTHNRSRKTIKQKKNESIKEFKNRVTSLKNSLNDGSYIEKDKTTFIEIAKKYIEQKYEDGQVSPRTHRRNLETIKQLEKCCSNFTNSPIQKIQVEDIEKSKSNMRDYSQSVIDKMWILINAVFRVSYSRRKISFNIMLDDTLKKPISKKEIKKIESLSMKEEQHLIRILNNEELNHKYRDIILLQLYTGMRIGEVLGLTRDCINLSSNTITVYRTLTQDDKYKTIIGEHTKTFKKTSNVDSGKRTFPMNNRVKALITKILDTKITNISNLLFWDYRRNKFITPGEINSSLQRMNIKYNICSDSLHSHRLRHTFITRCVESGMNMKVLQTLVGHVDGSSITFDVYTSVSDDFIKSELEKLN